MVPPLSLSKEKKVSRAVCLSFGVNFRTNSLLIKVKKKNSLKGNLKNPERI